MKKIKAFIPSILLLIFGIYILSTADSLLGKIIGIVNIAFWSLLITWAIFKIYKNSHSSGE